MRLKPTKTRRRRGYALLDVILAVSVFALVGTGVIRSLHQIQEASTFGRFDRLVQYGLESALTEAKYKPVREMQSEIFDEALGVTYTTAVEQLDVATGDGNALRDLYKLTTTATFSDSSGQQEEVAEIYVYQPEQK
ncbi:hypothetical protein N8813_01075 [bacterium]|jgi:type II secretory pathway component PulK|nr:hypothetical protein [bacterium]MDC0259287.1 hypothetical protein [Verrucomicrobiales bacterium]MDC0276185.1 hypothetical protein [Verrucomicrobiales bacterium]MDC0322300.1 hypothetical protein [Verrucomicrobiales bacterium]